MNRGRKERRLTVFNCGARGKMRIGTKFMKFGAKTGFQQLGRRALEGRGVTRGVRVGTVSQLWRGRGKV